MFPIICHHISIARYSLLKPVVRQYKLKLFTRYLSDQNITNEEVIKNEKKKKQLVPKITLISDGEKVEITTLEEAQKLSQRRNLKLVKIVDLDLKTMRPLYKLLSGSQFFAEELKQRESKKLKKDQIKGEKLLSISSKIAYGDLIAKSKLVAKWLKKNYEIRVIISKDAGENSKMEQIAKEIEKSAIDGKIVQKRANSSDIRFSIIPQTSKDSRNDSSIDKNNQVRSYHTNSS